MEQAAIDSGKILVFKIEDEEYATQIGQVERIIECEKITRIPEAPDYLKGVVNNQGRVVPVIDLKRRFNLPPSTGDQSKIIIARQDNGSVGLIVDNVSEVMDVDADSVSPAPDIISGIIKDYVKGIIKLEGRLIIYLNLNKILDFGEKQEIEQLIG
jgi:Chemotaxis signal transduction protein